MAAAGGGRALAEKDSWVYQGRQAVVPQFETGLTDRDFVSDELWLECPHEDGSLHFDVSGKSTTDVTQPNPWLR